MPAYKDPVKETWYASFYYEDWKGIKKKKMKRGFPTKKAALAWERVVYPALISVLRSFLIIICHRKPKSSR